MEFPGERLLIKLWETLAEKGVGALLEPWHAKRIGKANVEIRRNEMIALAKAAKEVEQIQQGHFASDSDTKHHPLLITQDRRRPDGRIEPVIDLSAALKAAVDIEAANSLRREVNVAKSIVVAEKVLENDKEEPPNEDIDEDWLYSWRDLASRVSTEELQELWGRVLAGELKNPGSFSIRTLEFLKGLSKSEAEIISLVSRFVIDGRLFKNLDSVLEKEGVSFADLLLLKEIGILTGVEAFGLVVTYKSKRQDKYFQHLLAGDRVLLLEGEDPKLEVQVEMILVSSLGREVLRLIDSRVSNEYLRSVAKLFQERGLKVLVADYESIDSDRGKFSNAQEL